MLDHHPLIRDRLEIFHPRVLNRRTTSPRRIAPYTTQKSSTPRIAYPALPPFTLHRTSILR
ncbi:hypothetical protein DL95DRAFT_394782, partial [Leptodontidium sp. 2 PMI_412]